MNKLVYWWLGTITCVVFMFLIILNVEIDLRKRQEADIKQLYTTIEKLEFSITNSNNKNDTIVLNINLDEHITKIKTKQ
jgi:Trk-type K+ transport system membrane component